MSWKESLAKQLQSLIETVELARLAMPEAEEMWLALKAVQPDLAPLPWEVEAMPRQLGPGVLTPEIVERPAFTMTIGTATRTAGVTGGDPGEQVRPMHADMPPAVEQWGRKVGGATYRKVAAGELKARGPVAAPPPGRPAGRPGRIPSDEKARQNDRIVEMWDHGVPYSDLIPAMAPLSAQAVYQRVHELRKEGRILTRRGNWPRLQPAPAYPPSFAGVPSDVAADMAAVELDADAQLPADFGDPGGPARRELEHDRDTRIIELKRRGVSDGSIAIELNMDRAAVQRRVDYLIDRGRMPRQIINRYAMAGGRR